MKPVNIIGEYYSISIPKAATGISFTNHAHLPKERLEWWVDTFGGSDYDCVDLPPGKWSIVSTSDEMTEEQAEKIVDEEESYHPPFYVNYDDPFSMFTNATESFMSLLKSHGLEGRQLILKQEAGEQNKSTQNK